MTSYFQLSRTARYSLAFALPLLVLYEGLSFVSNGGTSGIRNGADVLLRQLFTELIGIRGPLLFSAFVVTVFAVLIARDLRRNPGRLRVRVFVGMLAESLVLALAFGVIVGTITARLVSTALPASDVSTPVASLLSIASPAQGPVARIGLPAALTVSLGAGLYEELLFRVLLVGGLVAIGKRVPILGPLFATSAAVVIGALVFSAFHYIGPFGDRFTGTTFVFRAVAGLAFSALYVTRGFGITAWTHALYDVILLLSGAG